MLREIYRKVLPARVRGAARALLAGEPSLSVSYELAPDRRRKNGSSWVAPPVTARFKEGLETLDYRRLRERPESALESPIVRDNLALLERTGLDTAALLDFGCGNGLYRLVLAHNAPTAGWRYVGADVNHEVVEWCRAEHAGARFEAVGEGERLPFGDGEFDVALASGVLQCVDDFGAALAELRRVVRAYVLASRIPVWKREPTRLVRQDVSHAWGRESHRIRVFNRGELEEIFAGSGFSVAGRDYGSEFFHVPGVGEPAVHNHYLLKKV